jgi:hypothetical protein
MQPQLQSFQAHCHVIDVLVMAKRRTTDIHAASDELVRATATFLRLHTTAYGDQHVKPKHHWLMDIGPQLRRDSMVLDAFVIERNHLLVKHVADHCKNLTAFEQSVLRGVVHVKLREAQAASDVDTLLGKVEKLPGTLATVVADRMLVSMFEVSVRDIVMRGDAAGCIAACVCENNTLFVVVEALALTARKGAHTLVVHPTGSAEVWPAAELEHVVGWYANPDDSYTVVTL